MTQPTAQNAADDAETKGVTQEEFVAKLKTMGRDVAKLAFKGACVYAGLLTGGILLGGAVAGVAATYYGLGTLAFLGSTLLGGAVGGLGGFFGSKVVVAGMIEDLALKRGLELGDMGLRELMSLVKKAKTSAPIIRKPLEAIGSVAGTARKGVGFLRRHFTDADAPDVTAAPANDAKPVAAKKLKA